jgi:hypothetical protein
MKSNKHKNQKLEIPAQRLSHTALVKSDVEEAPPRSAVRYFPSDMVVRIALWIWSAWLLRFRCRSIITALSRRAVGLARFWQGYAGRKKNSLQSEKYQELWYHLHLSGIYNLYFCNLFRKITKLCPLFFTLIIDAWVRWYCLDDISSILSYIKLRGSDFWPPFFIFFFPSSE